MHTHVTTTLKMASSSTPRATIIRIDVDCGEDPYCIPPDNPYLGDPDVLPEIYAIGVRQPYTMTKDWGNRETGGFTSLIFQQTVSHSLCAR